MPGLTSEADRGLSRMAFADPASFLKGFGDERAAKGRGRRGRVIGARVATRRYFYL